jgi:hypothetical protein
MMKKEKKKKKKKKKRLAFNDKTCAGRVKGHHTQV